jgi:predicted Fe-Mo cluster-binding NifX family protein
MRIAIASKDGVMVNESFSKARSFYVYDVGDKTLQYLERRELEILGLSSDIPSKIKVLNDCHFVYSAKIGEKDARTLVSQEIAPLRFKGEIKRLLSKLMLRCSR